MESAFYPERFSRGEISPSSCPMKKSEHSIHTTLHGELFYGVRSTGSSFETLVAIAAKMKGRDGIDGFILGGTELSLILPNRRYDRVVPDDANSRRRDRCNGADGVKTYFDMATRDPRARARCTWARCRRTLQVGKRIRSHAHERPLRHCREYRSV